MSKYVIINYYYQTTEQVIVYYESNNSNYDIYNSNSTDNNDSIGKKEIIEVNETRNVRNYLYIDGLLEFKGMDSISNSNSMQNIMNIISKRYLCFDNLK